MSNHRIRVEELSEILLRGPSQVLVPPRQENGKYHKERKRGGGRFKRGTQQRHRTGFFFSLMMSV